ncbi:phosphonate C-P lyase system protein PhnG [Xanthobacter pseudotagetidis]|uniref:phosphonate C-P lyase system protein PhnG n=1 Tax=Xanthobacter pseudotagetidis TaxID=3119911 RepID=UPI00372BA708
MNAMPDHASPPDAARRRKAVMGLLARARRAELDAALARLAPVPAVEDLRTPEIGLVMVRGRIGGDGAPFNLGEATATRAAVRLEGGATGFGYRLGRAPEETRAAAILDALWHDTARRDAVEAALAPLAGRLALEAAERGARTAATKVDFFTLARGED